MSTYRLYRINPELPQEAELIDSHDREKNMARSVFRRWPVAACMPYKENNGALVLAIWETADDAQQKRTPIALVRTFPNTTIGFKQQFWSTPVSA